MSLFQQIAGVFVVAAEHAPLRILRRQQRQQGLQIVGGGALPNHDELPPFQLGDGVGGIIALVVRVDAGGDIGVEVVAQQAGGMAVNLLVVGLGGHDLLNDHGVRADHAGIVHHLRQPLHPWVVVEGINGAVIQHRAALVHGRGGNAGRQHKPHVHRQPLGSLQHVLHAVGTHDIGNLVGVRHNGGGAVGQNCLHKLFGGNHGALQVDMGVNKAREDQLAAHVELRLTAVRAHTYNQPLRHGNVPMAELIGEYVDIGCVLQHQVSLFPACGHLDDPQFLIQLAVDPAGIALFSHNDPPFLSVRKCIKRNRPR